MSYQNKRFSSRSSSWRPNSGRSRTAYSSRPKTGRRGPKKDYIHPDRFIKVAQPRTVESYSPVHSFEDFDVPAIIKQNLRAKGITVPSAIQDQAIPRALKGQDVIGIADTGSGKTAAFAVPVLNAAMNHKTRALIVAPTRELAQQIDAEFRTISRGSKIRSAVLIGGAGMGKQLHELRTNPEIVVGTPGRIKDHLNRGSLKLHNFKMVVLDEVDRMLDMGFVNDVRDILSQLSKQRQSLFFSATLDARVSALIDTFSNDPITISVKTGDTGENIHQNVVRVGYGDEKLDMLHDLLITGDIQKAIIFDDTQRSVERLSLELVGRGFKADAIHGGKSQGQRQRSLAKFKDNRVTILVATDVAARGIDITDITHVINYSTPSSYSDYVHRIGRAGRAGKVGHALTFVTG